MDRKINADGILALEPSLLKVPYELMYKSLRTSRKLLERDLPQALNSILPNQTVAQFGAGVETCLAKLQGLKRKLQENHVEEKNSNSVLKKRVEYLKVLEQTHKSDMDVYQKSTDMRTNRMIAEYLLRKGYQTSAKALIKERSLESLCDEDVFMSIRKVELSLQSGSCTECLTWCVENKASLRKSKSTLEFNLRLQEFIELVRLRKLSEAISYSKKHFPAWTDAHMPEIQKAMALLAFMPNTKCQNYQAYFDKGRWMILVAQFRAEMYALHSLSSHSPMSICLQSGMMALKTSDCYQESNKNIHCPVCSAPFNQLALKLPYSQRMNSCIVCRISGAIIDEDNPPMVLPNGNVYSLKSLEEMSTANNGKIVDPRNKQTYNINSTKKAFLA